MSHEKKEDKSNAQVTVEKMAGSKVKIFIKVTKEEFAPFVDKAIHQISLEIKMDGFRPGKIPPAVVCQKVGDEVIRAEAAELAIKKFYVKAIIENEIEVIGRPKVEIKKNVEGEDFEFEAVAEVLPEVVLKDGWKEKVVTLNKKHKEKKVEVEEKEISHELDFLADQRASLVLINNRAAAKGDQVEIDLEVLQDGVIIENGSANKMPILIGKGGFIPGFEEQIIGMKEGQEKEFELEFPKEYHAKSLAGKKANFKVKMLSVFERQVPQINDEFAATIGSGKFKKLEELKNNIKEGIEKEKQDKKNLAWENEAVEKIFDYLEIELPEVLVKNELDKMFRELEDDLSRMQLTLEQYLEMTKKTKEKLAADWSQKQASNRVKAALILRHLGKVENLEPTKEEVEKEMNAAINEITTFDPELREKIDLMELYDIAKGRLTNKKVIDWLIGL